MNANAIATQFSEYYYNIFDTDRSNLSSLYVRITHPNLFKFRSHCTLEGQLDDDMGRGRVSRHKGYRR